MPNADRKAIAVEFLRSARRGDRAALERAITPGARHHNAYFPAGMPALFDAVVAAAKGATDHAFDVKRVIADGDYVAVHSHVHQQTGDLGYAVVHILRFEGDRIAEFWDVGQAVPADCPNSDGLF